MRLFGRLKCPKMPKRANSRNVSVAKIQCFTVIELLLSFSSICDVFLYIITLILKHKKAQVNIQTLGKPKLKYTIFLSPPVLMHGGLLCVAICPSVCPSVCLSICAKILEKKSLKKITSQELFDLCWKMPPAQSFMTQGLNYKLSHTICQCVTKGRWAHANVKLLYLQIFTDLHRFLGTQGPIKNPFLSYKKNQ